MRSEPGPNPARSCAPYQELERYEKDPSACASGEWVDAAFAKDWHAAAVKWPKDKQHYTAQLSAIRLGDVALCSTPPSSTAITAWSFAGTLRSQTPLSAVMPTTFSDTSPIPKLTQTENMRPW